MEDPISLTHDWALDLYLYTSCITQHNYIAIARVHGDNSGTLCIEIEFVHNNYVIIMHIYISV